MTLKGGDPMSQFAVTDFLDRLAHAFREGDPHVDHKHAEAENVRLLREQYQAIARGDFDAAFALLADDVDFEVVGPPDGPFLGRWRGRAQVEEAVRTNFARVEDQHPEVQSLVAQGDTVVLIARERGRYRDSGRPYDVHWVQQFTFRDGRIVRVREIYQGEF
jgi:uncharacterized protein